MATGYKRVSLQTHVLYCLKPFQCKVYDRKVFKDRTCFFLFPVQVTPGCLRLDVLLALPLKHPKPRRRNKMVTNYFISIKSTLLKRLSTSIGKNAANQSKLEPRQQQQAT